MWRASATLAKKARETLRRILRRLGRARLRPPRLDFAARLAAAVGAPAGWDEQPPERMARLARHVLHHGDPFVEGDAQDVERAEVLHQPITARIRLEFG